MKAERRHPDELVVGLVSVSDRASQGAYEDKGLPGLRDWLARALASPWQHHDRLVPDERPVIEATLVELVDAVGCDLVLTTGGTGPARRDVTPEATLAVATREMPGFGEQMRRINLPGQPKAIAETLEGLKDADGRTVQAGIFAAVPYCIDLIGGPYVETHDAVVRSFRPRSALRPK